MHTIHAWISIISKNKGMYLFWLFGNLSHEKWSADSSIKSNGMDKSYAPRVLIFYGTVLLFWVKLKSISYLCC